MTRDTAIAAVHTLHDFLRDSRPQWTHEMPTREGYYWTRGAKRDHTMVVEVRVDYSIVSTPFVVQVGHPADTGIQFLASYQGCQWAGPIEAPLN